VLAHLLLQPSNSSPGSNSSNQVPTLPRTSPPVLTFHHSNTLRATLLNFHPLLFLPLTESFRSVFFCLCGHRGRRTSSQSLVFTRKRKRIHFLGLLRDRRQATRAPLTSPTTQLDHFYRILQLTPAFKCSCQAHHIQHQQSCTGPSRSSPIALLTSTRHRLAVRHADST